MTKYNIQSQSETPHMIDVIQVHFKSTRASQLTNSHFKNCNMQAMGRLEFVESPIDQIHRLLEKEVVMVAPLDLCNKQIIFSKVSEYP